MENHTEKLHTDTEKFRQLGFDVRAKHNRLEFTFKTKDVLDNSIEVIESKGYDIKGIDFNQSKLYCYPA